MAVKNSLVSVYETFSLTYVTLDSALRCDCEDVIRFFFKSNTKLLQLFLHLPFSVIHFILNKIKLIKFWLIWQLNRGTPGGVSYNTYCRTVYQISQHRRATIWRCGVQSSQGPQCVDTWLWRLLACGHGVLMPRSWPPPSGRRMSQLCIGPFKSRCAPSLITLKLHRFNY